MSNNYPNRSQAVWKSLTSILFLFCFILAACSGGETVPPGSLETDPTDEPSTVPTETPEAATSEPEPDLGKPIVLKVGEGITVRETGLTITFNSVERDGRCPSAVDCSESGPVVILISMAVGEQFETQYEMNPDPSLAALAGMPPNVVMHQKYEIELTAVEPYPEQPEDLMNMAYEATFIVR